MAMFKKIKEYSGPENPREVTGEIRRAMDEPTVADTTDEGRVLLTRRDTIYTRSGRTRRRKKSRQMKTEPGTSS
jgi:hypothetical protein